MEKIKLHIGCGNIHLDGYVNVDILETPAVDMIHDCRDPWPLDDGTVEEIRAIHLIEHLTWNEWQDVIKEWHRIMEVGGLLHIECPDAMKCMNYFMSDHLGIRWDWWHKTIWGDPDKGPGQAHKQGFTISRLRNDLMENGFLVTRAKYCHGEYEPDNPLLQYNIFMEALKK